MMRWLRTFNFIAVAALLQACSSATIKLETVPAGADVFMDNKLLGQTPLVINESENKSEFAKPFVELRLVEKTHEPLSLILKTGGNQDILLKLRPLSEEYFQKVLLSSYQTQANSFSRELLLIQGLLVNKKFDEAEKLLGSFLERYPNIAAAYLFKANIEISRQKWSEAKKYLERGISIDPNDSILSRVYEMVKKGGQR